MALSELSTGSGLDGSEDPLAAFEDDEGQIRLLREIIEGLPDNTQRKQAESVLRQYQAALDAAVNIRTEELRQANELLRAEMAQRKVEEAALTHERDLLRILFDNLPDPVYVKDSQRRFLITNGAFAKALGHSDPETLNGKTNDELSPPARAAAYRADDEQVLASGQTLANRLEEADGPAGERRWYTTTKVPFRNAAGQVAGLVGISRDITERRKVADALRDSESRYRALFEQAYDAIFLEDMCDNVIDVNQRAC